MSVINQTVQTEGPKIEAVLLKEEVRNYPTEWIMPRQSIQRYEQPAADTPFPLEYAFHLLGDLAGKTIVDLECTEGVNTLILASLGAQVISVDVSDKNLSLTVERARANGIERNITLGPLKDGRIPVDDARADRVLCTGTLQEFDYITMARQI